MLGRGSHLKPADRDPLGVMPSTARLVGSPAKAFSAGRLNLSAPATWLGNSQLWGCPVHCRVVRTIPSLQPLDASTPLPHSHSPPVVTVTTCLQTSPDVHTALSWKHGTVTVSSSGAAIPPSSSWGQLAWSSPWHLRCLHVTSNLLASTATLHHMTTCQQCFAEMSSGNAYGPYYASISEKPAVTGESGPASELLAFSISTLQLITPTLRHSPNPSTGSSRAGEALWKPAVPALELTPSKYRPWVDLAVSLWVLTFQKLLVN